MSWRLSIVKNHFQIMKNPKHVFFFCPKVPRKVQKMGSMPKGAGKTKPHFLKVKKNWQKKIYPLSKGGKSMEQKISVQQENIAKEDPYTLNHKEIGSRLKTLREINNLTQKQLGEKLCCSRENISGIERGETSLTLDNLTRCIILFQQSADYILYGIETSNYENIKKLIEDVTHVLSLYHKANIIKKQRYILDDEEIGLRLKKLRKQNNLSQKQLGEKLSCVRANVSGIESGRTHLTLDNLTQYIKIFHSSADYILYGIETLSDENIEKLITDLMDIISRYSEV